MNKTWILLPTLALSLVACDRPNDPGKSDVLNNQAVNTDNTGRAVIDRDRNALTPIDQAEDEADITITQNIRKALVADDSLSIEAKNIKIITRNGIVTLRGIVNNQREKDLIERKAQAVSGFKSLDNLLDVRARS